MQSLFASTTTCAYSCMCSAVSLDQLGTDVRVMAENFQLAVGELVKDQDNVQLRDFVIETEKKINDLKDRFQMAEDTYHKVVKFYGEDPKTTQPGQFFNEFSRFIAAYKASSRWSLCSLYISTCCHSPLFLFYLPLIPTLTSIISCCHRFSLTHSVSLTPPACFHLLFHSLSFLPFPFFCRKLKWRLQLNGTELSWLRRRKQRRLKH